MYMPDFQTLVPESLEKALDFLDRHASEGIMPLAGGTDLVVRMKEGTIKPRILLLLEKVSELKGIKEHDGTIMLGARTTHEEIIRSGLLGKKAPVLVAACRKIGSPQVRCRATLGGNIANASPCADSVPALVVLEARALIVSKEGERLIPLEDCFKGPKENTLNPGELIARVEFPVPAQPENSFYLEKGQRASLAVTKLSVAGQLELAGDGTVEKVRIAYGAVAPTVLRGGKVEAFLKGKKLEDRIRKEAASLAAKEVRPITDIRSTQDYRRDVTAVLLKRGLEQIS